jgi:hypothetical protein
MKGKAYAYDDYDDWLRKGPVGTCYRLRTTSGTLSELEVESDGLGWANHRNDARFARGPHLVSQNDGVSKNYVKKCKKHADDTSK